MDIHLRIVDDKIETNKKSLINTEKLVDIKITSIILR
jgi:hypothetical protein